MIKNFWTVPVTDFRELRKLWNMPPQFYPVAGKEVAYLMTSGRRNKVDLLLLNTANSVDHHM